ncbi:alanine racemase [Clostridia bacterium]|nr:alanine racemase [Clostridia bacterium]
MNKEYGAWIEVDLSALEHNYKVIADYVGKVQIMPVVKANGYGLGAVALAHLYQSLGAQILAVTRVEEAIELREAGIRAHLLLLMPFTKEQAQDVLRYELTPTISCIEQLTMLLEAGVSQKKPVALHLKLETGLGRTGFNEEQLPAALNLIEDSEELQIQGVFSHLAAAHQQAYTKKQIQRFTYYLEMIKARGIKIPLVHLANSTAILDLPETYYDLVRPGTILYGQHPTCHNKLDLQDPFVVKAKVLSISVPPKGSSIGYGLDQVSDGNKRIAVLGLGWADGLSLVPERIRLHFSQVLRQGLKLLGKTRKSHLQVSIGEKTFPFVGRIAMQTAMVEVDESVGLGDIARIPMRRLSANARLPRLYFYQGKQITLDKIEERINRNE